MGHMHYVRTDYVSQGWSKRSTPFYAYYLLVVSHAQNKHQKIHLKIEKEEAREILAEKVFQNETTRKNKIWMTFVHHF